MILLWSPLRLMVIVAPTHKNCLKMSDSPFPQKWWRSFWQLSIWGFTKGILKKTSETRKKSKINTRTQTRKISTNRLDNPSSPTHGVSNCKIRTLFWSTWKTKSKYENAPFTRLLYKGNTAKKGKTGAWNGAFSYLLFVFHVGQNNDLILQFDTPWVGEDGLLSRFADILRVWVLDYCGNVVGSNSRFL